MADTSRQWKRKVSLTIGKGGDGVLITQDFRIKFEVEKTVRKIPNVADIFVYNLPQELSERIKKEYEDCILECGYQDRPRVVFRGNIKHVFTYRDGADYITEIQAADGDKDYREAVVNVSLSAGHSPSQIVDAVLKAMGETGGTKRGTINLKRSSLPRGRVLTGAARDIMESVAVNQGAAWSIQDGVLDMVGHKEVLPTEAVVVNSETGMLSAPEISDKGIHVRMLLNPLVRCNGALKLDNNNVKLKQQQQTVTGPKTHTRKPARLDPDGIYKVFKVKHTGDTRGPEWMTDVECVGIGENIPSRKRS